uniref:Sulfotransfer_1 domain-containing protein n=1 Tax=Macrostomum lignano TaxID=282301 RepID=A0A1I8F723_9PLAT
VRVRPDDAHVLLPAPHQPRPHWLAVFALGLVLTIPLLLLTTSWRRGSHQLRRLKLALSRSPMGKYQAHVDVLMTERRPQDQHTRLAVPHTVWTEPHAGWPAGGDLRQELHDPKPGALHPAFPGPAARLPSFSASGVMRPQKLVLWYAKPPSGHYWELLKTNITAPVWEQRIVMIQRPVTRRSEASTRSTSCAFEAVLACSFAIGKEAATVPLQRRVQRWCANNTVLGALAPLLPDLRRRLLWAGHSLYVHRRHLQALSRPLHIEETRWTGRAGFNFGKMYGEGDRHLRDWQKRNYAMQPVLRCYGVQQRPEIHSHPSTTPWAKHVVSLFILFGRKEPFKELIGLYCIRPAVSFAIYSHAWQICKLHNWILPESTDPLKSLAHRGSTVMAAAQLDYPTINQIQSRMQKRPSCMIKAKNRVESGPAIVRYLTKRFIETYMSGTMMWCQATKPSCQPPSRDFQHRQAPGFSGLSASAPTGGQHSWPIYDVHHAGQRAADAPCFWSWPGQSAARDGRCPLCWWANKTRHRHRGRVDKADMEIPRQPASTAGTSFGASCQPTDDTKIHLTCVFQRGGCRGPDGQPVAAAKSQPG